MNIKVSFSDGVLRFSGEGTVPKFEEYYDSSFDKDDVKEIVIEEGITKLAHSSIFQYYQCEVITLPSTLKEIGPYAFMGCEMVNDLEIPESVKRIGFGAFSDMQSLMSITLPEDVDIKDAAFLGCNNLHYINGTQVDPSFIIWKGKLLYCSLEEEEEITVHCNVTKLCDFAFNFCNNLKVLHFDPNKIEEISSKAFEGCNTLQRFTNGYVKDGFVIYNNEAIGFIQCEDTIPDTVSIPNTVTKIGSYAFSNSEFTNIIIPSSVIEIEEGAFEDSHLLVSVLIQGDKLTKFGDGAFSCCESLLSIKMPEDVTLGGYVFDKCIHLAHINDEPIKDYVVWKETLVDYIGPDSCVDIPSKLNIKKIGQGSFAGNYNILEINVPEGVEEIGETSFSGCLSLQTLNLPSTIKKIGEAAFFCLQLDELKFPIGLEEIHETALRWCHNLKKITGPHVIDNALKNKEEDNLRDSLIVEYLD